MTPLISHDFEARYEAPADRRSVGIRPLVGTADDESGESPLRKGTTRLRTRIHEALIDCCTGRVAEPQIRRTGAGRCRPSYSRQLLRSI